MSEPKVGDVFRILEQFKATFQGPSMSGEILLEPGSIFTVNAVGTENMSSEVMLAAENRSVQLTMSVGFDKITSGAVEVLQVEEDPPVPLPPKTYQLSIITAQRNRNRPSANLFQMAASKLGDIKNRPDWQTTADGSFGPNTERVAKSIQEAYGLVVDGIVGKATWKAMTPDLGGWRAPIALRIAECECTWEAGKDGYGYYGIIVGTDSEGKPVALEDWWNYGIWNVNRGSAETLVKLGGAPELVPKIREANDQNREENPWAGKEIAEEVSYWFGSSDGRDTQIDAYLLKYTLKPSIRNLLKVGFKLEDFGIEDLDAIKSIDNFPTSLDPQFERILMISCDITINSGSGGFLPHKSPREWDREGELGWADKLPDKEACKKIYSEEFGQPIPDDNTYVTADSSEPYRKALSRCLWELCSTNDQRAALIAELQARCIVDRWRDIIIRRRRAASWPEGYVFQQTFYRLSEHWGIGVDDQE